ncbi:hypothetical protein [Micromonospora sp. DT62]|uniref:hypothetical protein n=1 Tax=Micromonospora sp. DT62 TaxID=3416521 RepID=UPI003CEE1563
MTTNVTLRCLRHQKAIDLDGLRVTITDADADDLTARFGVLGPAALARTGVLNTEQMVGRPVPASLAGSRFADPTSDSQGDR